MQHIILFINVKRIVQKQSSNVTAFTFFFFFSVFLLKGGGGCVLLKKNSTFNTLQKYGIAAE